MSKIREIFIRLKWCVWVRLSDWSISFKFYVDTPDWLLSIFDSTNAELDELDRIDAERQGE